MIGLEEIKRDVGGRGNNGDFYILEVVTNCLDSISAVLLDITSHGTRLCVPVSNPNLSGL